MAKTILMPLNDGGTIAIETVEGGTGPVMRGGREEVVDTSVKSFEETVASVRPVATALIQQLANAVPGVGLVKINFGLKFNANAGVLIASAGTEANFAVEVKWGS